MKKLLIAIISISLWAGQALAADEARIDSLAREFLAYCGNKTPRGVTFNADSTKYNIDLMEFIADPVAKRYFEQMGQCLLAENVVGSEKNIEIRGLSMEKIDLNERGVQRVKRRAVAIPQVTFCLSVPYTYMSVDGKNNPVRLSSMMYRPSPFQFNYSAKLGVGNFLFKPALWTVIVEGVKGLWNYAIGYTFDYGVLGCHPTVTSSAEAPTGAIPLDGSIKMFCSDYALVVCPDYCGYGLSSYKQHPYLVQGVTARNVVDGYIAALDLVKQNKSKNVDGSWELASDFYTDLMGYSQGGSVALSTLRYLESGQVSSENLKRINLRNVYCGDGPYSPIATIKQYVDWANRDDDKYRLLAYPCVLPLIVQAAKDAYDNDCMRIVKVEDFFTPEFLATGIIENLNSKSITTEQLNAAAKGAGIFTIDQMMSKNIIKKQLVTENGQTSEKIVLNTETNEFKCLMRALDYNDVSKGWTPQHPLLFMHLDGDLVVPYCNMEEVKKNMKFTKKVVFTDPYQVKEKMSPIWSVAANSMGNLENNPDHSSIGVFFYIGAASGTFEEMLK